MTLTKTAAEVFAPTTLGGAARSPILGEAAIWGTEIEGATGLFGTSRPTCLLRRTANLAVPTSVLTPVPWTVQDDNNPSTMHSLSSDTDEVFLPVSGLYQITFKGFWAQSTSNSRYLTILVNNVADDRFRVEGPGLANDHTMAFTLARYLTAGTGLKLAAWQNSGGNLNLRYERTLLAVTLLGT
ncbi:hypothetical protein [Mongoliimonas terrestris]|uniref:hypothetical protein n=1 Tax=Mongoliimonas terrestris TaxID=1709001 RepID=UPI000949A345|nr:hypothetical protein [Mongoliimonas terrestris]